MQNRYQTSTNREVSEAGPHNHTHEPSDRDETLKPKKSFLRYFNSLKRSKSTTPSPSPSGPTTPPATQVSPAPSDGLLHATARRLLGSATLERTPTAKLKKPRSRSRTRHHDHVPRSLARSPPPNPVVIYDLNTQNNARAPPQPPPPATFSNNGPSTLYDGSQPSCAAPLIDDQNQDRFQASNSSPPMTLALEPPVPGFVLVPIPGIDDVSKHISDSRHPHVSPKTQDASLNLLRTDLGAFNSLQSEIMREISRINDGSESATECTEYLGWEGETSNGGEQADRNADLTARQDFDNTGDRRYLSRTSSSSSSGQDHGEASIHYDQNCLFGSEAMLSRATSTSNLDLGHNTQPTARQHSSASSSHHPSSNRDDEQAPTPLIQSILASVAAQAETHDQRNTSSNRIHEFDPPRHHDYQSLPLPTHEQLRNETRHLERLEGNFNVIRSASVSGGRIARVRPLRAGDIEVERKRKNRSLQVYMSARSNTNLGADTDSDSDAAVSYGVETSASEGGDDKRGGHVSESGHYRHRRKSLFVTGIEADDGFEDERVENGDDIGHNPGRIDVNLLSSTSVTAGVHRTRVPRPIGPRSRPLPIPPKDKSLAAPKPRPSLTPIIIPNSLARTQDRVPILVPAATPAANIDLAQGAEQERRHRAGTSSRPEGASPASSLRYHRLYTGSLTRTPYNSPTHTPRAAQSESAKRFEAALAASKSETEVSDGGRVESSQSLEIFKQEDSFSGSDSDQGANLDSDSSTRFNADQVVAGSKYLHHGTGGVPAGDVYHESDPELDRESSMFGGSTKAGESVESGSLF